MKRIMTVLALVLLCGPAWGQMDRRQAIEQELAQIRANRAMRHERIMRYLDEAAEYQRSIREQPIPPMPPPSPRLDCTGTDFGGIMTLSCR